MVGSRISPEELALFNSQLAAIARSEVPALPGLRALSRDIRRSRLRQVLDRLTAEVESGKPLPEALSAVSGSLPPTYTAIVQAGIESRNLPTVLESMTRHYQATEELKQKVRTALIYPGIIYVLCLGFLFFLSFILRPHLYESISDLEVGVGSAEVLDIIAWSELGLGVLAGFLVLGLKLASLGQAGAKFAERFFNSVPIYGQVGRNGSLARFSSTLGFLLDAKVPLPKSLQLTRLAVGSPLISDALENASERTSQGASLSESLGPNRAFPHTLIWMVSQGEQTNTLAETFHDLADFYTSETNRRAALAWNATPPLAVLILLVSAAPAMLSFWVIMVRLMTSLGEGW